MPPSRMLRLLRHVPAGLPGKMRLARRLLRRLPDGPAWIETPHGSFHVPSTREPVAFHLLVDGRYEGGLLRLLARCLRPGDGFVDVGANVGVFSVPASRLVRPGGSVLAIEASPAVLPYLRRTLERNGSANVHVASVAAAAVAGSTSFWEAPSSSFGMGSCTPRFHDQPVQVPTAPLDRLLLDHPMPPVRVVKLDVEGAEADVLRGARELLLGATPPLVVFEFADWAEAGFRAPGSAQAVLLEAGFALRRIEDFLRMRPRWIDEPLTKGTATLVAESRRQRSSQP